METVIKAVGAIVIFFILIVALAFLFAYPTLWAVNYLFAPSAIAAVFGVPQLTFWKALVLNYVAGALIKGTTNNPSKT